MLNSTSELVLSEAQSVGFESIIPLDCSFLVFSEQTRYYCSICECYDHWWSCPPACPDINRIQTVLSRYPSGILLQTVRRGTVPRTKKSDADQERLHQKRFLICCEKLKKAGLDVFPFGAGRCSICSACTYPDNPCRFPEKMISSMEAYGLDVADICRRSGVPLLLSGTDLSFASCILY